MSESSFIARVRSKLDEMHPAERRLGELICDFPGEMASYSASELARLAGVSNATVTRFVRHLGYRSFSEARRSAREESRTGSRLFLESTDAGSDSLWLESYSAQSVENLEQTLTWTGPDQIDEIANTILSSRKVWVIGYRANHSFATYIHWQLSQVIENITVIPSGGQTMGEHLVNLNPDDCVIVFGLRRRVLQLNAILASVVGSGAKLLYLTDEAAAGQAGTTWHIKCQTRTPGPLFDHVSVMAISYALVSRVIELSGASGRTRLHEIEKLHDQLSEL